MEYYRYYTPGDPCIGQGYVGGLQYIFDYGVLRTPARRARRHVHHPCIARRVYHRRR